MDGYDGRHRDRRCNSVVSVLVGVGWQGPKQNKFDVLSRGIALGKGWARRSKTSNMFRCFAVCFVLVIGLLANGLGCCRRSSARLPSCNSLRPGLFIHRRCGSSLSADRCVRFTARAHV